MPRAVAFVDEEAGEEQPEGGRAPKIGDPPPKCTAMVEVLPPAAASVATDHPATQWTPERLLQATYKDLGSPSEVEGLFYRHLLRHCRGALIHLLQQRNTNTRDYSLNLNAFDFAL